MVGNGSRRGRTAIRSHTELKGYQEGMTLAMEIFELSKRFPKEQLYSLTDQVRRSSRSLCANLAETWRKRGHEAAFINKPSDVETEAAETQVWVEFAVRCKYLQRDVAAKLCQDYESVLGTIVGMITHGDQWTIKPRSN